MPKYKKQPSLYIYANVFPNLETLLKHAFWYHQQLLFRYFHYLLNRSNTASLHRWLQFCEERKKSTGAKPGEYGGWAMVTVLFLAKNSRTSIDMYLVRYQGSHLVFEISWVRLMSSDKTIHFCWSVVCMLIFNFLFH